MYRTFLPRAASNALRSASFSYFANRGPANQVGGQVRLQPTGLVAIMHTTTHASHDEIEEETERKDLCCAYDVDVCASHDEIQEEEVQSLETKSQATHPLRDNVVYWKTNGKINNDFQYTRCQRRPHCSTRSPAPQCVLAAH